MPPRYAYWTILVDDQPTAFRAALQEDLLPTLKRLQLKNPSAKMMWFQNGKLWPSRLDAQDAMRARGEMGRRGDARQSSGSFRDRDHRPEWKPKFQKSDAEGDRPRRSAPREGGLDWKPKGSFDRERKPEWKPRSSRPQDLKTSRPSDRPEWKPKGSFDRDRRLEWKPKPQKSDAEGGRPRRSTQREGGREGGTSGKLEWKPKGSASRSPLPASRSPEKRKWVPKEEYKKSQGIEARRDKNWRPGGEHKDPRQKYKDAKKAKWSRFKQNIRTRWESKNKKKD